MSITLRYFAVLREIMGRTTEDVTLPAGTSIGDVRAMLANRVELLQDILPRCVAARNRAFAEDDTLLADGDELVFLPPMAGG